MFRKNWKVLSIVLAAIVALVVIAACGGGTPAPAQPPAVPKAAEATKAPEATKPAEPAKAAEPAKSAAAREIPNSKTFVAAWTPTDPPSLDPHVCNDSGCLTIVWSMYDPLLAYKYGVKFSDGSPVKPEDVVYSFDRLSGIGKGPAWVLSGAYDGGEVIDAKTVTIKLKKTIGPFLYMLPRVFIVNSKVVKEHATNEDKWGEKWLYDHDAGSGAFVMEKWEHGVQVSIVKNLNYWDPEWPKVERFVERPVAERVTDRLLLEKGEVDTILNPVMDVLPAYKANPDVVVSEDESLNGLNIMISQIVPPLNDVRVRKAIALTFDYPAMVDGVYKGHAVQTQGPLPRRMKFHDNTLPIYQKDIKQAKALLAEAGYPNGFETEILVVQGNPFMMGAAQILHQGLAEVGVKLKITELAWAQVFGRIQNRSNPAPMYTLNSFPAYNDPDSVLWSYFHTSQQGGGYNGTFYGNAETDALLEKGRFTTDEAQREVAYKQLQKRLFDDHVAVWLVNQNWVNVRRAWVKNYQYDATWNQVFRPDRYILEGKP